MCTILRCTRLYTNAEESKNTRTHRTTTSRQRHYHYFKVSSSTCAVCLFYYFSFVFPAPHLGWAVFFCFFHFVVYFGFLLLRSFTSSVARKVWQFCLLPHFESNKFIWKLCVCALAVYRWGVCNLPESKQPIKSVVEYAVLSTVAGMLEGATNVHKYETIACQSQCYCCLFLQCLMCISFACSTGSFDFVLQIFIAPNELISYK